MATRTPAIQPRSSNHSYWGSYASIETCPNAGSYAGTALAATPLEAGDTAYVPGTGLVLCIDAGTIGGLDAVWVTAMQLGPANFDAFGRLRVSDPGTIFDSKLVVDAQPLYWAESLTGAASSTYLQSDARVRLATTAAGAQTAIRQTKRYFTYQPGKSQQFFVTFNLNGGVATTTKRVGYFDATNGLFLELNGVAGVNLVRRSGSSVATVSVAQAAWNIDPFDGTGPSGITLDFTKTQILICDFEWLGVGSCRMGFNVGGATYYAHEFENSNVGAAVYMSTPNLPIRYELATSAGVVATMDCICATVMSEGGTQNQGTPYSYVRTTPTGVVATLVETAILRIRPAAANVRVSIKPSGIGVMGTAASNIAWRLVMGGTFATAFATTVTTGYAEVSETTSVYTPNTGDVLASGLISSVQRADVTALLNSFLTIGADVAGTPDILSLVISNISAGNETYRASMDWLALT